VQGNGSHAVLPFDSPPVQRNCESSRVAHGASKRRWAP